MTPEVVAHPGPELRVGSSGAKFNPRYDFRNVFGFSSGIVR
jgi:hypothetical protein